MNKQSQRRLAVLPLLLLALSPAACKQQQVASPPSSVTAAPPTARPPIASTQSAPATQRPTVDVVPPAPEKIPAIKSAATAPAITTRPAAPLPTPATARVRRPITDFGALADGKTINTAAIQKAIDTIAATGGTVIIPEGTFLCGALFLKPGVNIHLDKNAVLKGSTDTKDYPLTRTRIEGHFQDWLPALINADAADHLVIDGEGTLDGSGEPFWAAFRSAILANRATKNLDVPRPRLLFIANSKDVHIAGIHLLNSGFWNLHLYKCHDVAIDALDIRAGAGSPSTDGIDIDSSQSVTITNTFISNNDDCIALKGTKGPFAMDDKDSPPVEHIRVSNCTFAMGASVITCGSEATVVRDVVVDHCMVAGPNTRGVALLRLKLRTDTPQDYQDIHYKNITLDGVGTLISIAPWTQYQDLMGQPAPTHTVKNMSLSDIKGTFGSFGSIRGNAGDTLTDLTLENINVKLSTSTVQFGGMKNVTVKNVSVNGKDIQP